MHFKDEGGNLWRSRKHASMRWWKKRMAFCNEMHTDSKFVRHESEQTSYPGASLQKGMWKSVLWGKANDGLELVRPHRMLQNTVSNTYWYCKVHLCRDTKRLTKFGRATATMSFFDLIVRDNLSKSKQMSGSWNIGFWRAWAVWWETITYSS